MGLVQKLKSKQGNFSQEIEGKDKEITNLMTEYTDLITNSNNNLRLQQQLMPEEVRILQKRPQGQQSRIQEPQDLKDYKEQHNNHYPIDRKVRPYRLWGIFMLFFKELTKKPIENSVLEQYKNRLIL